MIAENLSAELATVEAELRRHMASWEYAFAMGSSCHGQGEHPTHWATRAHTEQLLGRCRDLRARLAEHQRQPTGALSAVSALTQAQAFLAAQQETGPLRDRPSTGL